MKSCEQYEPLISAFLDGELSGDEKADAAEHLAVCPVCQRYFDDLMAIHDVLEREEAPVPEGFADQVMAGVRETPQDRAVVRFPRWKRWTALAACCAIAALALWTLPPRHTKTADQSIAADSAEAEARGGEVPAPAGAPAAQADDGTVGSEAAVAEEDSAPESGEMKRAIESAPAPDGFDTASVEPAPASVLPAAAPPAEDGLTYDRSNGLMGTVSAGGPAARAWVEETLGQEWEAGRVYQLTEEEYAALLDALMEAEEAFQVEPDGGCRLVADD